MMEGWKKLLASFLIQCKIIDKEWSGEIKIGVNEGHVTRMWRNKLDQ